MALPRARRIHPLEDGLWSDRKFDPQLDLPESTFEEKGFFAFLFGNPRQRSSGIYRATDEQLAADTSLPIETVQQYLSSLDSRGLIVRDPPFIFTINYFKRMPKNPNTIESVRGDLEECPSERIIKAFMQKYPLYRERLNNPCALVGQRGAEAKELLDFWFLLFTEKIGEKPPVMGGRDMECARAILQGRSLDQAKAIVRFYFDNSDDYQQEHGLFGINHIRGALTQTVAKMALPVATQAKVPARTRKNLQAAEQALRGTLG